MSLIDKLENISFLFPIVVVFITAIGFLIRHYFFGKKDVIGSVPFVKAGSHISAGGDIIIGNKSVVRDEESLDRGIMPKMHISPLRKRDRLYAEIYNTGDEDISNLVIVIYSKQKGISEKRELSHFFNENEDPILESGHCCAFMRKGEKKIVDSLPMHSDDGKIKFTISGLGVRSNKKFSTHFFVNNIKNSDH
jgi:hypothetical protein